jgi:hypothetical protein
MTDKSNDEVLITNESTLIRRAWIETAVKGARTTVDELGTGSESRDSYEEDVDTVVEECVSTQPESGHASGAEMSSGQREGSHLYVAWSAPVRRSGT